MRRKNFYLLMKTDMHGRSARIGYTAPCCSLDVYLVDQCMDLFRVCVRTTWVAHSTTLCNANQNSTAVDPTSTYVSMSDKVGYRKCPKVKWRIWPRSYMCPTNVDDANWSAILWPLSCVAHDVSIIHVLDGCRDFNLEWCYWYSSFWYIESIGWSYRR